MGKRRAAVLLLINVLMVIHVLQWWHTGRTLSPIEPSETMYTLREGKLNAGFIFFSLALLSTLILGRWVCGWGCHIVALQDLCGWFMKKIGVKPKPFRSRLLKLVPLGAALYMFVWPTAYQLVVHPFKRPVPPLTNHLITEHFWATFPPLVIAIPFLAICGFATVYFLGAKGFCTYACPYGGFFGLVDRVAPGRIRVTSACDQCGHCTAVCTSNVKVNTEVRDYGMVVDPGCMKCMDCVSVCPNEALYFGFSRAEGVAAAPAPRAVRQHDITWPEEILAAAVFLFTFFAVRGVYDAVPFLMALGIAGIVAYAAVKFRHLFTRPHVSIQNLKLRSAGRIQPAGWLFVVAFTAVLSLTAHCAVIQACELLGNHYFARVNVPDDVLLAGGADSSWRTPEITLAAERGRRCFDRHERWGIFASADARLKLAFFDLVLGRYAEAVDRLREAGQLLPEQRQAHCLYFLGSALRLAGRPEEAIRALQASVQQDGSNAAARDRLGTMLGDRGRLEEAMAQWSAILAANPEYGPAHHKLAVADGMLGRLPEALQHFEAAARIDPENLDVLIGLVQVLMQLDRKDDAKRYFAQAVKLEPRLKGMPQFHGLE